MDKGASEIKEAKFSNLYKNLYLSFPSAKSMHMSKTAQISGQCMSLILII